MRARSSSDLTRRNGRAGVPVTEREPTCQELTEVLTEYLEDAMPAAERARFEAHLERCDGCLSYVSQLRLSLRAVRALRTSDVEATVPDDLLDAFRAWRRGDPLPDDPS